MAFELWLGHLDRDNSGEAFAEVFACNLNLRLLYLLRYNGVVIGVCLERTCQCHAETREVGTAFDGVDVVNVRVNVLTIIGIVHHGHLNGDVLFLCFEVDNIVKEVRAVTIYVAYKLFQSIFGMERLGASLTILIGTKVGEGYLNACIEVRQFAHTRCDDVPTIYGGGENIGVGPKLLTRSALISFANYLYGVEWLTRFVFLLINFAVAEHLRQHSSRQCVYTANTHTMKSTAHLIRAFVELTASV